MIVLSAVEVVRSIPERANQWMTLRRSHEMDLGLWELPNEILSDIADGCNAAIEDAYHASNIVDKFRITMGQIESILYEREHPRGLIRRTDFVPRSTFLASSNLITEDALYQAVFDTDEVSWLTRSVNLPPVQPWPNVALHDFRLQTLTCLFARTMKDECFASIQQGPVVSIHEARLTESGVLRIMDPSFNSRASIHKGRLVWVAENRELVDFLWESWDNEEGEWLIPFGLESFCRNFMKGSLHVVEGMDVTNSKIKMRPSLLSEGAEFMDSSGEPADANMDLPGASRDAAQVETRLERALVSCVR